MFIGLLMILLPIGVFLVSLPFSRRLRPGLRKAYRILGGIVVFLGSGTSIYFAAYSGDQGGIAAFYLQLLVISLYVSLSLLLVIMNWALGAREADKGAG